MATQHNRNLTNSTNRLARSVLFLASAALLPLSSQAANSSSAVPLFTQTVDDNRRISEGYANFSDAAIPEISARNSSQTTPRNIPRSGALGLSDIWVSDISTVLFNDSDHDGYFAGFSVTLDVDVSQHSAEVYANFYLQSRAEGPNFLHSTNVFRIYEQDSIDRYRVDVDLTDSFFAGEYDLIIDVIDAQSTQVADTVSHRTHSNLGGLPLESNNYQFDDHFVDNDYYSDDYYDDNYGSNLVTTFSVNLSSGSSFNGNQQGFSSVGFGVNATVTEFRGSTGVIGLLILAAAGSIRARGLKT